MGRTPVFALPYPDAGDRPCDAWSDIAELGNELDGLMRGWQRDHALVDLLPTVIVASSQVQLIGTSGAPIAYDSVMVDTLGGANLSYAPNEITLGRLPNYRTGYYEIGIETNFLQDGVGTTWFPVTFTVTITDQATGAVTTYSVEEMSPGPDVGVDVMGRAAVSHVVPILGVTSVTSQIPAAQGINNIQPLSIMYANWVSEL